MFSFGRDDGHHVDRSGSSFVLAPLTGSGGGVRAACLHRGPGDVVGDHEATAGQLFCVVSGSGWVSGSDRSHAAIAAHQAVFWDRGEMHAAGTETGMTVIVLEGHDLSPAV